jgi:hypothetical protein
MEKRWSLSDDVNIKPLNLRSNRAINNAQIISSHLCGPENGDDWKMLPITSGRARV